MTQFIDLRHQPVGGELVKTVALGQGTTLSDYTGLLTADLLAAVRDRQVLIATHGFNVNRADGIASLSNWERLLQLPPGSAFVGLLWPGDSVWAHGLDYPDEPKVADDAGKLLAPYLDANFEGAASISFASHSLGARVVLSTIARMNLPVRRLTLMAGAINDNCLNKEFQAAAAKVGAISVLASKKDTVLSRLFPIGNFFAGIIDAGHPWWRAAIGHRGPVKTWPSSFVPPFEIPDAWDFNHGDYLQVNDPPAPPLALPVDVPAPGAPPPAGVSGWQETFTAAFESSRFH
ncbi:MAG TPA: alpha/beta hydrolase [Terracidiphilus sp.]|nr:alpha/beta hydrolase [Terracidiphilus sp.]